MARFVLPSIGGEGLTHCYRPSPNLRRHALEKIAKLSAASSTAKSHEAGPDLIRLSSLCSSTARSPDGSAETPRKHVSALAMAPMVSNLTHRLHPWICA